MSRITNPEKAFSEQERRDILDRYFVALKKARNAEFKGKPDEAAINTVQKLWRKYIERTPVLAIAKNPYTGDMFAHSFDPIGLDGLWWDHRNPARHTEPLPDGVLAFTGAIRLREPIEDVQFLCMPGPGRPFVVPRVLGQEGVKAVMTRITVGPHVGYGTVYFYAGGRTTAQRFNTWGIQYAAFSKREDDFGWAEFDAGPEDFDFGLEPWVEQEKLLWTHPDDEGLENRSGVAGCPFIGLEGEPLLQATQAGKVWTQEPYVFDDPVETVRAEYLPSPQQPSEDKTEEPSVFDEPGETVMRAEDSPDEQEQIEAPVEKQGTQKKFCGQCGHEIGDSTAFCGNCGAQTKQ